MGDSTRQSVRSINPWVLHLQKLGLELKCPLCLNLLKQPLLLPCDHIFCNDCLPRLTQFGSECPVCKAQYVHKDLRPMPFIENMVTMYRTLDAAFCASMFQPCSSDTVSISEQRPASIRADCNDKLIKISLKGDWGDNSSGGQSVFSLPTVAPLIHSVENGIQRNIMENKCYTPIDAKRLEIVGSGDDGSNVQLNVSSPPVSFQIKAGGLQKCGTLQTQMNQVDQLSPGNPPSFGEIKGSDDDSNYQGSDDSPQIYQAVKLGKRNSDERSGQERNDSSASGTEKDNLRDLKRQKRLNYGPLDKCARGVGHINPMTYQSEAFNSQLEVRSEAPLDAAQPPAIPNESAEKNACGFCQSTRISEDTGPMLHYVKGKQVDGDEATLSNAIHVHWTCIEWTPQVYFTGEKTVKNLKAELARGAKLKCSKCGLKGAALGCYIKSCRKSYHVPCAMRITNCRWDSENFLLLCPAHSSAKFPNEKSKKHDLKHFCLPVEIAPQQSNFWKDSSNGVKKWVFCGSALSPEEKSLLVEFGTIIGAPVTKSWKSNVTHVIAATDAQGACTRTLKFLMAILNGRWVLSIDWVKACMESMHPVDEEPYEVSLDNHGCSDGPRTGRLSALNNGPKLLNGLSFYFVGDFLSGYKEDLQDLVITAGGAIWEREEELVEHGYEQAALSNTVIVYNVDPPQGCQLGEEVSIIWQRLSKAQDLAAKIGSQVVGHTWLLESIAAYKLQPFVS